VRPGPPAVLCYHPQVPERAAAAPLRRPPVSGAS